MKLVFLIIFLQFLFPGIVFADDLSTFVPHTNNVENSFLVELLLVIIGVHFVSILLFYFCFKIIVFIDEILELRNGGIWKFLYAIEYASYTEYYNVDYIVINEDRVSND